MAKVTRSIDRSKFLNNSAVDKEDLINDFINRGGKTIKETVEVKPEIENVLKPKHINVKIPIEVYDSIQEFRKKVPRKIGSPKLGISLHEFILEAIVEKLERQ